MNKAIKKIRRAITVILMLVLANVILLMGFSFHTLSWTDYTDYTDNVNNTSETLIAKRGDISDRNGNLIVTDVTSYNILAFISNKRPSNGEDIVYVEDKEKTAELLAPLLNMEVSDIMEYFNKDLFQTELGKAGRNISEETKNAIEELNLPGIEFIKVYDRYYPNGSIAANTVGFVQFNYDINSRIGAMGIEQNFNKYLSGIDGSVSYQTDANGYLLPGTEFNKIAADDGDNISLTFDLGIQETLSRVLDEYSARQSAIQRSWGAVLSVETGEMLALDQNPTFDLTTMNITDFNNFSIDLPYEVGSTFKPFTYAAVADNNSDFNLDSTYYDAKFYINVDENGDIVRTNRETIHGDVSNYLLKSYGNINFRDGFAHSSNVAIAVLLDDYIQDTNLAEYYHNFGFYSPIETDGFRTNSGQFVFDRPIEKITTAFGQASTVTLLHMLQGYTAIMNDGVMVKPYFVKSIIDSSNNEILYEGTTEVVGQPISAEAAELVRSAMEYTASSPYSSTRHYKINESDYIAKTGTADVPENGEYRGKIISSVVIGLPADDPQVLVYLALEGYGVSLYVENDLVKQLLQKIAITMDLSNETNNENGQELENDVIFDGIMPSLVNHSINFSENLLNKYQVNIHKIGSGNTVIRQYPNSGDKINKDQRVFLLSDYENIIMPDMSGWTRKDVLGFFSLIANVDVIIVGSGNVAGQSISAGTKLVLDQEVKIEITLR
ncbi:MAG: penicillin-binding protein [Erysipelotrichaceae bacterium]